MFLAEPLMLACSHKFWKVCAVTERLWLSSYDRLALSHFHSRDRFSALTEENFSLNFLRLVESSDDVVTFSISSIKVITCENISNSLLLQFGLQASTKTVWLNLDYLSMNSTYSKDFGEIPAQNRFRFPTASNASSEDNLEDFCTGFTSSDESFSSNASKSSTETKNENFDLSLRGSSTNGSNHAVINTQKQSHKSLQSIARLWKNFRSRSDKSKQQQQPQSILRKPTEYFFVKGMSGLPLRVVKTPSLSSSSQASCHRCIAKNSAIS